MKIFLVFLLAVSFGYGAEVVKVDEKYQESTSCKTCHKRIVDEWSNSWHAKSHFKNDEYFRKTSFYPHDNLRLPVISLMQYWRPLFNE